MKKQVYIDADCKIRYLKHGMIAVTTSPVHIDRAEAQGIAKSMGFEVVDLDHRGFELSDNATLNRNNLENLGRDLSKAAVEFILERSKGGESVTRVTIPGHSERWLVDGTLVVELRYHNG